MIGTESRTLTDRLRMPGDGRASVTLEGLLTGASLWLAYNLLMEDSAAARSLGPRRQPGSMPTRHWSEEDPGDGVARGARGGYRPASNRGRLAAGALEDPAGTGDPGSGPSLLSLDEGGSPRPRSRPGEEPLTGWRAPRPVVVPESLPLASPGLASAPETGGVASAMAIGGGGGVADGGGSVPSTGSSGAAAREAAIPVITPTPSRTPAVSLLSAPTSLSASSLTASGAVVPIPAIDLAVVGEETIVARSFAGPAALSARSSQVAMADTGINAQDGNNPWIRIASSRLLHGLAASTLGAADLDFTGETIGARKATLTAGEDTRAITIAVSDALRFGLDGQDPSTAQIRNRTVGMEATTIQADAGVDALAIATFMDVNLDVPRHPDQARVSLNLETMGLSGSEIHLGDTANRVLISTALQRSGTGMRELAEQPGDSLSAVAVANSSIDTGGGDDQVWVSTPTAGSDPVERIGLLASSVDLGAGDDLLRVDGNVRGSLIRPGGGSNTLLLDGQVEDSRISLEAGSTSAIALGAQADGVALASEGPVQLSLDLGGGDDKLLLDSADLSGSVSGGTGADRLAAAPLATNQLSLDLGADSGWIDGLSWDGFEQFNLGDGDDTVLFNWTSPEVLSGASVEITAGTGQDLFLFSPPDGTSSLLPPVAPAVRPRLADVTLAPDPAGGIGLTDRFGWYAPGLPSSGEGTSAPAIHYLTPSDSSGLGTATLLPIAPLGQLLEGISSGRAGTDQLAIALDEKTGGELLLISGGRTFSLVDLPFLSGWNGPIP